MIKLFVVRINSEESKKSEVARLEQDVNDFQKEHPGSKLTIDQSSGKMTTITIMIEYQ